MSFKTVIYLGLAALLAVGTASASRSFEAENRVELEPRFELEIASSSRVLGSWRAEDRAYRWDWRGRLYEVTCVDPDYDLFDHQVAYDYDALGRLLSRSHYGPADGGGERALYASQEFVWNGDALLGEIGLNADGVAIWRKIFVPGPGLDDAVQVVVEQLDAGDGGLLSHDELTILRDELGSVLALVDEAASSDPEHPAVVARYHYTPFGQSHVELGPELRRAVVDQAVVSLGTTSQNVAAGSIAGGFVATISPPLESLDGVSVERRDAGGWVVLRASELAVGRGQRPSDVVLLPLSGWVEGASYRVTIPGELADRFGRAMGEDQVFDFLAVEPTSAGTAVPKIFEHNVRMRFDSAETASDRLGGLFPAGQTSLFQGLWTDPVTGMAYARARWLDHRNQSFLSEDPVRGIDSPSMYTFVAGQPHMYGDPTGEIAPQLAAGLGSVAAGAAAEWAMSKMTGKKFNYTWSDAGADFAVGAVTMGAGTFARITGEIAGEVYKANARGDDFGAADAAMHMGTDMAMGKAFGLLGAVTRPIRQRAGKFLKDAFGSKSARVAKEFATSVDDDFARTNHRRNQWGQSLSRSSLTHAYAST